MKELEKIFNKGLEFHHYVNTAYPLEGNKVWRDYKLRENVDGEIESQWRQIPEIGLYVHIPFCKKRCLYCEYTVLSNEESELKDEYVHLLLKEIEKYKPLISHSRIVGMDIGGGTPTSLSLNQIEIIKNNLLSGLNLSDNFSISIETTPYIATNEIEKLQGIRRLGIERISMGMQTIDPKLLEVVGRGDSSLSTLIKARDNIRVAGFARYNIDLMYGFAGQSIESFDSTLNFAIKLAPEYITLYRNRYKGTKLEKDASRVSLKEANELYSLAFGILTGSGYKAGIGKNTFSRISGDPGTSAYLTKRVIEGTPYLGLGLGAQSLASSSIYYNEGAASKKLGSYRKAILENRFPVQDFYLLPPEEIMAKMICVSFYFGAVNQSAFKRKFGISLEEKFSKETKFLLDNGLMKNEEDLFQLTEKGKDNLNGIIPLFYSYNSRENLLKKEVKNGV
jgi:oxygen-independent coproporphyrinogen-3 oxidase